MVDFIDDQREHYRVESTCRVLPIARRHTIGPQLQHAHRRPKTKRSLMSKQPRFLARIRRMGALAQPEDKAHNETDRNENSEKGWWPPPWLRFVADQAFKVTGDAATIRKDPTAFQSRMYMWGDALGGKQKPDPVGVPLLGASPEWADLRARVDVTRIHLTGLPDTTPNVWAKIIQAPLKSAQTMIQRLEREIESHETWHPRLTDCDGLLDQLEREIQWLQERAGQRLGRETGDPEDQEVLKEHLQRSVAVLDELIMSLQKIIQARDKRLLRATSAEPALEKD